MLYQTGIQTCACFSFIELPPCLENPLELDASFPICLPSIMVYGLKWQAEDVSLWHPFPAANNPAYHTCLIVTHTGNISNQYTSTAYKVSDTVTADDTLTSGETGTNITGECHIN